MTTTILPSNYRVLIVHSELNPCLPINCFFFFYTFTLICSHFITLMGSGGKTVIASMNWWSLSALLLKHLYTVIKLKNRFKDKKSFLTLHYFIVTHLSMEFCRQEGIPGIERITVEWNMIECSLEISLKKCDLTWRGDRIHIKYRYWLGIRANCSIGPVDRNFILPSSVIKHHWYINLWNH